MQGKSEKESLGRRLAHTPTTHINLMNEDIFLVIIPEYIRNTKSYYHAIIRQHAEQHVNSALPQIPLYYATIKQHILHIETHPHSISSTFAFSYLHYASIGTFSQTTDECHNHEAIGFHHYIVYISLIQVASVHHLILSTLLMLYLCCLQLQCISLIQYSCMYIIQPRTRLSPSLHTHGQK